MLVCLETPRTASPPWAYVPRSLWPGPRSPVQGWGVACPGREKQGFSRAFGSLWPSSDQGLTSPPTLEPGDGRVVQLLPVGGGRGTASLPGRAGTQPPEFTEHVDHQTLIPGCMWSSFSAGLVALGAQASGLPSCPGVLRTSESSL